MLLLLALAVVLFGLAFLNPVWWVATALVVYVLVRYGRDGRTRGSGAWKATRSTARTGIDRTGRVGVAAGSARAVGAARPNGTSGSARYANSHWQGEGLTVRSVAPARRAVRMFARLRKGGVMRRTRTIIQALTTGTLLTVGVVVNSPAAQAITIPVACSEGALVAAINLANSTATSDTLVLASGCTYAMTAAHGGLTNALPVITTPVEMIGPATVTRTSLLPFRIAEVSATGSLTLTTSVAFTNGSAVGNGVAS